jgi:hypothetical protein
MVGLKVVLAIIQMLRHLQDRANRLVFGGRPFEKTSVSKDDNESVT